MRVFKYVVVECKNKAYEGSKFNVTSEYELDRIPDMIPFYDVNGNVVCYARLEDATKNKPLKRN